MYQKMIASQHIFSFCK